MLIDTFLERATGIVHEIVSESDPHGFRLRCMPWPPGVHADDFGSAKVTCILCLDGYEVRHDPSCVIYCCHTDPTTKCLVMHHCRCGRTD